MKKTLIFGISSGIAAYKVIELIHKLNQSFTVRAIITEHTKKMLSPEDLKNIKDVLINSSLFPQDFNYKDILSKREVEHIKIADSADLFIIAPATANIIGKITHGIADDFLTTTLLATKAPILLCPSMNVNMWENPVVQENIRLLKNRGLNFIDPDSGALACGYEGTGRLADLKKIESHILSIIEKKNLLKGKKILVTSGGTSEAVDSVRILTNRSSGKMGAAIAEEAALRGAHVRLVKSKSAISPNLKMEIDQYETSEELDKILLKHLPSYDYIFHTAAVSDFKPESIIDEKISSEEPFTLTLIPSKKIINTIKDVNRNIKLIGFKAVYKKDPIDMVKIGRKKLKESNADFIIVNDISKGDSGFESDNNEVLIVDVKNEYFIPWNNKKVIAEKVINKIFQSST